MKQTQHMGCIYITYASKSALIATHICTSNKIPLGALIRQICSMSPPQAAHKRCTHAYITLLITSRAGSFSFPDSHAMTSQGLTYSQCYRAARIKSD